MQCFTYIVFALFFSVVNSTFWFRNDFERVMGAYKEDLSLDYLRALSIFKRKLQLLGFYPIVSNDDGLEYVSLDPYLIEDDYDDRMYELLKKMKKEKKARRKLLKKKLKKTKKTKPTASPTTTTTAQPISNIVYYWPSTITTIIQPGEGHNTYEHSIDTLVDTTISSSEKKPYDDVDSSEENSSEIDDSSTENSNSNNYNDQSKVQKPASINYEISFGSERKLTFQNEDENDSNTRAVTNQTSSSSSTSTTTPYPLLTIFPDPDEVAIQDILDQQEIVNKITPNEQRNTTEAEVENHDVLTADSIVNVGDNFKAVHQPAIELPSSNIDPDDISDVFQSIPEETTNEEKHLEKPTPSQSTEIEIISTISIDTTQPSSVSFEATTPNTIPAGVLQFFHETLPETDDHLSSIGSPSTPEIIDNIPLSGPHEQLDVSNEIAETTENDKTNDGHSEIHSEPNNSVIQVKEETTWANDITQPIDVDLSTSNSPDDSLNNDDTAVLDFDVRIQTDHMTDQSEGYEYSVDPKVLLTSENSLTSIEIDDDFGSRSLTDNPKYLAVAVSVDDKGGRRSDVPIEADDVNDEDTTDGLPYNFTDENSMHQNNAIENTSAETSTPPPTPDAFNLDDIDQLDGEIIPLIPIIIKQLKQGNVIPEEMEILKNTFRQFWPFIVEEASRESDSSEEMNPLLSEVLNSVNRRVVKREATIGSWRRPIYGRRIYFDDDDDYVPRRRYYSLRRRPVAGYYYK